MLAGKKIQSQFVLCYTPCLIIPLTQVMLKALSAVLEDVVSQTSRYFQTERSQSFLPELLAHLLPLPCSADPLEVTLSYFNS